MAKAWRFSGAGPHDLCSLSLDAPPRRPRVSQVWPLHDVRFRVSAEAEGFAFPAVTSRRGEPQPHRSRLPCYFLSFLFFLSSQTPFHLIPQWSFWSTVSFLSTQLERSSKFRVPVDNGRGFLPTFSRVLQSRTHQCEEQIKLVYCLKAHLCQLPGAAITKDH